MKELDEISITRVYGTVEPHHKTGARHHMEKRISYALSFSLGGVIEYRHKDELIVSDESLAIIHPMGESYDFICTRGGAFAVINFYTTHLFTDKFIKIELNTEPLKERFYKISEALSKPGCRPTAMRLMYEILEILTSAKRAGGSAVLQAALSKMEESFARDDFTVSELARSIHISESYLRRVFTDKAGISPKRRLMNMRIGLAKKLLEETSDSVGDIAERSGFSGVYHFCRAFREAVGVTPTDYRKTQKEKGIGKWQM